MPPLSQEFKHHLHELMVETSDRLREELNGYKQRLVWEAQKRNNSAGIPIAYSDAAVYAFRTRVQATIDRYLQALETCGIVVDAEVEREMLKEIASLTSGPKSLSLPPGVTGPTVGAVQAEHGRKMERAGNALYREAANRLRELKMKAIRNAPAVPPVQTTPQSVPFTIASVAKTLAELKSLPTEEQAMILLRRLVQIYPTVRNTDKFHKGNILLPNDNCQIAMGFSDAENMRVREHLLGGSWTRLVNEGYLVDPRGSGFFDISEDGFAAAERAARPAPAALTQEQEIQKPRTEPSADGRPTVFISYSWESTAHQEWVLHLAERLRADGGVNVILDRWHLRLGQDKTLFMEENVAESDFVLVVCTPEYAEKANKRRGGVGYEAMIITGELAADVHQTRFIPVLRQGAWDKTSMPRWLTARTGADLRGDPYKESEYEGLVRELHGEHLKAPQLGPKPTFPRPTPAFGTQLTAPAENPIQSQGAIVNLLSQCRELVTVEHSDGKRHENVRALVTEDTIIVPDAKVPISTNDIVLRQLPSGLVERMVVTEPTFYAQVRTIPAHYQLKYRRQGQGSADTPGYHIHVTGDNARINIGSADSSVNVLNQQQPLDLNALADELALLRSALVKTATTAEEHRAIGALASAELEAKSGDRSKMLNALSTLGSAGKWVLDGAKNVGVAVAAAAIKAQLGI
jgi:TIR domain